MFIPESITQKELLRLARKAIPELTKIEEATIVDCDSSCASKCLKVFTYSLENIPVIAVSSERSIALDTLACSLAKPIFFPLRPFVGRPCSFQ